MFRIHHSRKDAACLKISSFFVFVRRFFRIFPNLPHAFSLPSVTSSAFFILICHKFACKCVASEYTFREAAGEGCVFLCRRLSSALLFPVLVVSSSRPSNLDFSERFFNHLRPKNKFRRKSPETCESSCYKICITKVTTYLTASRRSQVPLHPRRTFDAVRKEFARYAGSKDRIDAGDLFAAWRCRRRPSASLGVETHLFGVRQKVAYSCIRANLEEEREESRNPTVED